jgi:hypothetical protein
MTGRGHLRHLVGSRPAANEIDDRHLPDWEREIPGVVLTEVQVAIDEVFVLTAVENDRPTFALAGGQDECGALIGREGVNAGARDECDG